MSGPFYDCEIESAMKYMLWMAIILSLVVAPGHPQGDSFASKGRPEATAVTFAVNAGLVVLPVSVKDKSGKSIAGLEQGNFTVFEDGAPQRIELFEQKDAPVAVGLVIDNSGSLAPKRVEVANAAAKLAEYSNADDQIFVLHFHERISYALKLGEAFTSDVEELKSAVSQMKGVGRTAFYDAVLSGLEHVERSVLPKKILIVVSDGVDNASRRTKEEMLQRAAASDTIIYSIGIYNDHDRKDPGLLKQLSRITGGEAYFPRNAGQLTRACKRIAADIRTQYTLGYVPDNQKRDGRYRSIRVDVSAPNRGELTARTRSGYPAPETETSSINEPTTE